MAKRQQNKPVPADVEDDDLPLGPADEDEDDADLEDDEEDTILDIAIDDIPDLVTLPNQTEALLRITSARKKMSRAKEEPMIEVVYECVGVPDEDVDPATVKAVRDYIMLGNEEDSSNRRQEKLNKLKQWARCFSVPREATRVDLKGSIGQEGWVVLNYQEAKDGFAESNGINRFIAPR